MLKVWEIGNLGLHTSFSMKKIGNKLKYLATPEKNALSKLFFLEINAKVVIL